MTTNLEWLYKVSALPQKDAALRISRSPAKCRFCSQVLGCCDVPGPCVEHIEKWLKGVQGNDQ